MEGDICRVCRCESQSDRPLFHPCICTGSIKWIHQDCLTQWMRYSRKEYCELCGHKFSFTPIYSPDMPRVLPLRDVAGGLLSSIGTAVKYWLHYTLVAIAWLGIVPLTAYRTYRFLFSVSFDMLLTLPVNMLSTGNIGADVFRGCFVVMCTLFAFIGLVWLREQILHGGGPDWLERDDIAAQADAAGPAADAADNIENENDNNNNINNNDEIHNNNNNNNVLDNNILAPDEVLLANDDQVPIFGPDPEIPIDPIHQNDLIDPFGQNNPIDPIRPDDDQIGLNDPIDRIGAIDPIDRIGAIDPIDRIGAIDPIDRIGAIDPDEPDQAVPPNENEAEAEAEPEPAAEAGNDDVNWNPMEWDRAAEELTWERVLGLDGSMVFLEHVFWVISLNTLFIFIFAYCPYSIGNFAVSVTGIIRPGKSLLYFHGLLTTLIGYCVIGVILIELHSVAKFFKLRRPRRILGLCYIVVKVSLLSVVEIGVLPLVCGWWLDICSLPMFDATLKDRKASFIAAPGTSLFIHWMFGMVYVYYFASFIVLLREVLRPGVLWFLRNLNDPDFNPIQEMIHLSIFRHTRRLIASAVIFGSAVLLMLWSPIQILKTIWPSFLPYTLSGDSEVNELSLQLLLLQIILPGFFEQSHTRIWLKGLIRIWCSIVSWVLGIKSYLLGTEQQLREDEEENNPRPQPDQGAGLGAVHQNLLQRDVPVGFQPYEKPSFFVIRLLGLMIIMCISLVVGSLVTLTVPVWIGRYGMALWSMGSTMSQASTAAGADSTAASARPHELYTAAMGTYLCWVLSRGVAVALNLLPQGRTAVIQKIKYWLSVGASYTLAAIICILMLGVIPLMFGLLLELVVVVPLRVPLDQTPVLFLWQDWALGVLYTKIACALTLMGPDWSLKRAIEQAYRDGLRDMNLKFIIFELAIPIVTCFGLALAIPYVLAHSIAPLFIQNQFLKVAIIRRIYPFFLILAIIIAIVIFQIKQFKKLYVAIKNDKYLVGQRLVNYDHQRKKKMEMSISAAATTTTSNTSATEGRLVQVAAAADDVVEEEEIGIGEEFLV